MRQLRGRAAATGHPRRPHACQNWDGSYGNSWAEKARSHCETGGVAGGGSTFSLLRHAEAERRKGRSNFGHQNHPAGFWFLSNRYLGHRDHSCFTGDSHSANAYRQLSEENWRSTIPRLECYVYWAVAASICLVSTGVDEFSPNGPNVSSFHLFAPFSTSSRTSPSAGCKRE